MVGERQGMHFDMPKPALTHEAMVARFDANFQRVLGISSPESRQTHYPPMIAAMVDMRTTNKYGIVWEGVGHGMVEKHGLDYAGEGVHSVVFSDTSTSEHLVSLFKNVHEWSDSRLERTQLNLDVLNRLFPKNFTPMEVFKGTVFSPEGREIVLAGLIRKRVIPRDVLPQQPEIDYPISTVKDALRDFELPMVLDDFNQRDNEITDNYNAQVHIDIPVFRGSGSMQYHYDEIRAYMEGKDQRYRPQRTYTDGEMDEVIETLKRIKKLDMAA